MGNPQGQLDPNQKKGSLTFLMFIQAAQAYKKHWLCPALHMRREEDKGDLVPFFKELCFLGDLSTQPEKGKRMEG